MVSLGCHVRGAALPHPEMRGWRTQQCAVEGRLGCSMPPVDKSLMRQLRTWSYVLACTLLHPVTSDYFSNDPIDDVQRWLALTHYPAARKADLVWRRLQLLDEHSNVVQWLLDTYECKGFVKDETYPEWKIPRGIHPESDQVKVVMGPLFKAIELDVYKLKWFVKHVPVLERANYIMLNVERPGFLKLVSDFSSFEAGFSSDCMRAIEFQMYKYMLKNCPQQLAIMKAYEQVTCGWKKVFYHDVSMRLQGRRMSGQMCTSLGNTWTNFVILTYMLKDYMSLSDMRMVVEGDDGLVAVSREVYDKLDMTIPVRAGFKIKMEVFREIELASFCGNVFDAQDRVNVTDPVVEVASLGWSGGQAIFADHTRQQMLLRSKSMSLAYQYPSCPVIQAVARYGLRVTSGVCQNMPVFIRESNAFNMWDRDLLVASLGEDLAQLVLRPIPFRTRLLVEKLFSLSLDQQDRWEKYFDSLTKIQPFDLVIERPIWAENYARYAVTFAAGTSWSRIAASRPFLD
jgi:hypothetical protein